MATKEVTLAMLDRYLKRANYELKKEITKDAIHDAKILKDEINKSFDENTGDIQLDGYYLEGKGPVITGKTIVIPGSYDKVWERPKITITPQPTGVYVTASGRDVIPLEFGSGIDGVEPSLATNEWWVMNSDEGYYKALDSNGGGNWYRAIEIATGNSDPLLSTGTPGSRFFSKGNKPSYFMSKGVTNFNNALNSERADLKLTSKNIAGFIDTTLGGGQ